VRNLCSLLPLPLIPLLCPVGTPSSTMADMQRAEENHRGKTTSNPLYGVDAADDIDDL
jgi:hypothetical protein